MSPDEVRELIDAVWFSSILDFVGFADPEYGGFSAPPSPASRKTSAAPTPSTCSTAATRVQRICAERLYAELDANPEQATLIRGEANKKTRHKSMRELLDLAPDVLLTAKPCWAMSPLVVSHTSPDDAIVRRRHLR